jgi:phage baseplate assembly protein W
MVDTTRIDKITSARKEKDAPFYSDFYNNLNKHPGNDNLVLHTNEEAVKRAIRNIIQTNTGERLFNPTLGCGIRSLLFEDISPITADLIREKINESIKAHEPRARVLDTIITPNEYKNSYEVSVIFQVINSVNPTSISLTLYRVR